MPLTAPAGPLTLAEHAAAITLRDCTEFRTWCGATSEATAAARIHFDWPPPPPHGSDAHSLQSYRPYAIVWQDDDGRGYGSRRIAAEAWEDSGRINVQLVQDVVPSTERSPDEIWRRFKNSIGRIISYAAPGAGLEQLAGTSPDADHCYLAIQGIDVHGPVRCGEDVAENNGDYLLAQLTLHWGNMR